MASGVVTVAVGREGDLVFLIGFAVVLTLMAWVMGYAIDVFGIRESDMSYTLDQQWAWNEKFSRFCQEEIFYPLFVKGLREVLEEFKEELGKVTEKKSV